MKYLWAPWRMTYIKSAERYGCFFCKYSKQKNDKKNLILYRGDKTFCMINKFPYNTGHVMVATKAHKGKLNRLTDDEMTEMFKMSAMIKSAIDLSMKPHGYNIGINLGRTAGAGIVGHIHMHIVPRWNGDTNYMPVVANTKVMPIALDKLYNQLASSLDKIIRKGNRNRIK